MRNRAFAVLFLSVFGSTLGIGMVSPILPVVAKDLGATGAWLGLAFSSFAITQAASTLLIGRLSDRWGRKRFIFIGFALYGSVAVGYTLAGSFEEIILWRALAGFGMAATFPIAAAYVGDLVPAGREGTYMGTFNVANWIGFGTGPLLGGVIRDALGADGAFWTMAALLFGMAVIVGLLLPSRVSVTGGGSFAGAFQGEPRPQAPLRAALRDNVVRAIALFNAIDAVAFGTAFAFMAVYLEEEFAASGILIGVVLATRTYTNGALAPLLGRLADRFDRTWLMTIGIAIAGVTTFFLGDAKSVALVLVLFTIVGVAEGIAWPAVGALSIDRGRVYGMGAIMGLGQTAMGVGILGGAVIGGALAGAFDFPVVFRFGAIVMLVGAIGIYLLARRGSPAIPLVAPGVAGAGDGER